MYMDEKRYAVLLTETQDIKVMACNPDKQDEQQEDHRAV